MATLLAIAIAGVPQQFLCAKDRPNAQLFVANLDGSELTQITDMPDWHFGSPEWSHDGQQIAVDGLHVNNFDGRRWKWSATHLFVMNADGSDLRDIGPGAMPSWSPDGRLLVCHAYGEDDRIIVLNSDGSGREGFSRRGSSPMWSPDGKTIAWRSGGGFVLLDLQTGRQTAVVLGRGHSASLGSSWSSAGGRICYEDSIYGGLGIATLTADFKCDSVEYCTGQFAECSFPSWSPDDSRIVFSARQDERTKLQLYTVSLESSEPVKRLEWQTQDEDHGDVDWAPHGDRIVFCRDVDE